MLMQRIKMAGLRLHSAAQEGHKEVVELLLGVKGIDVNAKSKAGVTPLRCAAEKGHNEVVGKLIKAGAKIMEYPTGLVSILRENTEIVKMLGGDALRDRDGRTLLHRAVLVGDKKAVEILICVGGANVNTPDENGRTPLDIARLKGHTAIAGLLREAQDASRKKERQLIFAALRGNVGAVRRLIAEGVNVNAQSRIGFTPLHIAAQEGHTEIVRLLIGAEGIEVNTPSESEYGNGWTPLHRAAFWGHKEVVELLLGAEGINVNAQEEGGWTPLYSAAQEEHTEVVKVLLGAVGIDVNTPDKDGRTQLYSAAEKGHTEVVEKLIAAGANVNAQTQYGGTPLHIAAFYGHKKAVELLIGVEGINVNTQSRSGFTPLHSAAFCRHKEVVELLIGAGADADAQDKNGFTPLDIAMQNGHTAVADILREAQDASRKKERQLIFAALRGNVGAVRRLIAEGVNVNAQSRIGFTPLHIAAQEGHTEIVRLLIGAEGIEVNTPSESEYGNGWTPLHRAAFWGHKEVVELLLGAEGINVNAQEEGGWDSVI